MKNIKLAIIALLGFSTACSTAKEGSKSKNEKNDKDNKVEVAPSIVVMYGVRRPIESPVEVKQPETHTPTTDTQSEPVSKLPEHSSSSK